MVEQMSEQQEDHVLPRLQRVSGQQGLPSLQERLLRLHQVLQQPLSDIEQQLHRLVAGGSRIEQGARQLIAQQGKRLRPLCVVLASRVGTPDPVAVHRLAVAVELVHSATLLHDDVVDMAPERRGVPATRVLYGNTLSIFAGDWLLIEAMRLVHAANIPSVLDELLSVVTQMIESEALQLELRGTFRLDVAGYVKVIEGKTASLFRWAMRSGGRAGGLPDVACDALGQYGHHLGLAFQIMDDLLDVVGQSAQTGKESMRDVSEGKMTLPLIFACERDPALVPWLQQHAQAGQTPQAIAQADVDFLRAALVQTEAIARSEQAMQQHIQRAVEAARTLPPGDATTWLIDVALQSAHRSA